MDYDKNSQKNNAGEKSEASSSAKKESDRSENARKDSDKYHACASCGCGCD